MRYGILLLAGLYCLSPLSPAQAKIEAIKGKKYTLSQQHGPWMVMVAVFSEPPEEMKGEGITPEQAANELVYELRQKGIPAYYYWRDQKTEVVQTVNRLQQTRKGHINYDQEICVLAGNYKSPEGDRELARRTLDWVKKFKPHCLEEGGIYKPTPGQPGPLSGAFLTINPMLDPAEVRRRQKDPEVIRYNAHFEYSLLDNPGKYSMVVASFYGNSITQVKGSSGDDKLGRGGLDLAADQSWQVMRALREKNVEAYVFHDRHKSVVTVGSFRSPNDPEVQSLLKTYTAQWKTHAQTNQPYLDAKTMVLPSKDGSWLCTFDPNPQLIEVPYK